MPCNSHWHTALVATLIGSAITGILLVIVLLVFNITVASGFITEITFYASIVTVIEVCSFQVQSLAFPQCWLPG